MTRAQSTYWHSLLSKVESLAHVAKMLMLAILKMHTITLIVAYILHRVHLSNASLLLLPILQNSDLI